MADSSVPITAGAGTTVDTYQLAGGDHQQVVREARASSVTRAAWTVSLTAATVVAADTSRIRVLMVNTSTGRVWVNLSSTLPTSSVFDWYLDPGERWEVPAELCQVAFSFLGQVANGTILYLLAVAS